ncbi:MAG: FAD-dependent oxidoreductase [Gemmatimonadales bacterium]|nr:FAD-dependent oxidoreductase [Gemmatimonadales bacterium]
MHVVLLGDAPAQLFVLEALARGRLPSARVTLVSPNAHYLHHGLRPALVAGTLDPAAVALDLRELARRVGADFIQATPHRLDPGARRLDLDGAPTVEWDVLALGLGTEPRDLATPGVAAHAVACGPETPPERVVEALERLADGARVLVVGDDIDAVELAFAVRTRLGARGRVGLVAPGPELLPGEARGLAALVAERLAARGITLALGGRSTAVEAGGLVLGSGARVPAALVLWAAAPAPGVLLREAGLALDDAGRLATDEHLRSTSHPGVYDATDGPVLARNLAAAVTGRSPAARTRHPRPLVRTVDTADGRAVLSRDEFTFATSWAARLRRVSDERFIRRFRELRSAAPS